ncbi:MAG: hypothetical protein ABI230_02010 [Aestuariivirga sp.]
MAKKVPVKAFSPEDMKRRRSRSVAMALALVAFVVIIFITAIVKMKGGH